jgi:hypothetical protein
MTHLPYIVGSYGLALALAFWFGISAFLRTGAARRKLAALDTRREARGRA